MNKKQIESLKKRYNSIVNDIIDEFCKKQGFDEPELYWVAEEIGSVLVIQDEYFFNFSDILYDINNKIKKGLIFEWQEYVVENRKENDYNINYSSYLGGARYEK